MTFNLLRSKHFRKLQISFLQWDFMFPFSSYANLQNRRTDRQTECNPQWTIYRTGFIRVYLPVWKPETARNIHSCRCHVIYDVIENLAIGRRCGPSRVRSTIPGHIRETSATLPLRFQHNRLYELYAWTSVVHTNSSHFLFHVFYILALPKRFCCVRVVCSLVGLFYKVTDEFSRNFQKKSLTHDTAEDCVGDFNQSMNGEIFKEA